MANEIKDQEQEKKGDSVSTMKIVVVAVILSILVSGGMIGLTLYLVDNQNTSQVKDSDDEDDTVEEDEPEEDESEEVAPDGEAQYQPIDPKFVISFKDQKSARFMQFSIEVMSRNEITIEKIKLHMPAIRSNLLLLFSGQEYEKMSTRVGKEALLSEIAIDVNNTLERLGEKPAIEAAYFVAFVIQ